MAPGVGGLHGEIACFNLEERLQNTRSFLQNEECETISTTAVHGRPLHRLHSLIYLVKNVMFL